MSSKGTSGNALLVFIACMVFTLLFVGLLLTKGCDAVTEVNPNLVIRITWSFGGGSSKTMNIHNEGNKELRMRLDYVEKGLIFDSRKTINFVAHPGINSFTKDFKPGETYSLLISGASSPITGTIP